MRTIGVFLSLILFGVVASFGCHPPDTVEPISVPKRFWLESAQDPDALSLVAEKLRASVGQSFRDGLLQQGFPRECSVTKPPMRAAPFDPECLAGDPTPDGLLLDSIGSFIQFVPIDFLSARAFLFEVYLIPEAEEVSSLTPEALLGYPHVAIPYFPLSESTYAEWLNAVVRGILAVGARSFETKSGLGSETWSLMMTGHSQNLP